MTTQPTQPEDGRGDESANVGDLLNAAGGALGSGAGQPPAPPDAEPPEEDEPWFVILGHLGRGGMGEVLLARDRTGQRVALKLLTAQLSKEEALFRRLLLEARTMGALVDPRRVARVLGFFKAGEIPRGAVVQGIVAPDAVGKGRIRPVDPAVIERIHHSPVLVMQYVPGLTLREVLSRRANDCSDDGTRPLPDTSGSRPPFGMTQALRLGYLLALAILELHRNRPPIEHRDLKPGNVMVTRSGGRLVILDLGLGRACWEVRSQVRGAASQEEISQGPPAEGFSIDYAAPEQVMGLRVGTPADVWAFGCILVELLTGSRPFEPELDVEGSSPPPQDAWVGRLPPHLPQSVAGLLKSCLRGSPQARATIRDAVRVLRPFARAHSRAGTNFPSNVPIPIGRGPQVRMLCRELAAGQSSAVGLLGLPGVGKSRVALAAAARMARRKRHRPWVVCHVEIDPARPPTSVDGLASEVLAALRHIPRVAARLPSVVAPGEGLEVLVGVLQRRVVLLLLDGVDGVAEHLPRLAAALDRGAADTVLLTTSREAWQWPALIKFDIDPLRLPDPRQDDSIEALERTPATRLFLEVARSVRGSRPLWLTPARAACIARICRELGGLPWAIESVAARTEIIEVESLEERLMPLLLDGATDSDRLPSSVCNLLSPPARTLLARLSLFRRGFSLTAAEAVCGDPGQPPGPSASIEGSPVVTLLGELARLRVVRATQGDRFRHVEPYRRHAAFELGLRSGVEPFRSRFVDWCMALVERGLPEHLPPGPEAAAAWFDAMELDLDNVRAALAALNETRGTGPRLAQAVRALRHFWWRRGPFADAWSWCQRALDRIDELEEPALRCQLLDAAAVTAMHADMDEEAEHLMRAAIAEAEAGCTPQVVASVHVNLAMILRKRGRLEQALGEADVAAVTAREHGPNTVALHARLLSAVIAKLQGRLDEARMEFEDLRPALAQPQLSAMRSELEQNLGEVAVAQDRLPDALGGFRAAWRGHGRASRLGRFRAVLWMGIARALAGDRRGGRQRLDAGEAAYKTARGLRDAWLDAWIAEARRCLGPSIEDRRRDGS